MKCRFLFSGKNKKSFASSAVNVYVAVTIEAEDLLKYFFIFFHFFFFFFGCGCFILSFSFSFFFFFSQRENE